MNRIILTTYLVMLIQACITHLASVRHGGNNVDSFPMSCGLLPSALDLSLCSFSGKEIFLALAASEGQDLQNEFRYYSFLPRSASARREETAAN